eukprot:TRINITY_DN1107_c0_g1_i1.p1 TRINITY_DN1107_c0_g1~~TRINITY_DN1107_c0_g1_i1.p1  ORF type:complete len:344 (+),score=128.20 TRINITY_DN1107_c0_g1_i1:119-1033(+)
MAPPDDAQALPSEEERLLVHEMSRVPERIVLCVDVGDEMDSPWDLKGGKTLPRLTVVKKALQNFVQLKSWFSPRHSFALCSLTDEAEWLLDFTSDAEMVQNMLEGLHVQHGCDAAFDLGKLFATLQKHCPPPPTPTATSPPDAIVRVILLYGRSAAVPRVPPAEERPPLLSHPCFYLDALYVHAHPNEEVEGQPNECQGAYDALHAAISGGATATAYLCEQIHNARMLGRHLTLLLAHGAQRQPRDVLGRHVYYNADPAAAAAAAAGGERGASQPPQARPAGEGSPQRCSSTSPPAERMQQQQE